MKLTVNGSLFRDLLDSLKSFETVCVTFTKQCNLEIYTLSASKTSSVVVNFKKFFQTKKKLTEDVSIRFDVSNLTKIFKSFRETYDTEFELKESGDSMVIRFLMNKKCKLRYSIKLLEMATSVSETKELLKPLVERNYENYIMFNPGRLNDVINNISIYENDVQIQTEEKDNSVTFVSSDEVMGSCSLFMDEESSEIKDLNIVKTTNMVFDAKLFYSNARVEKSLRNVQDLQLNIEEGELTLLSFIYTFENDSTIQLIQSAKLDMNEADIDYDSDDDSSYEEPDF